jgi:hypothetical protein
MTSGPFIKRPMESRPWDDDVVEIALGLEARHLEILGGALFHDVPHLVRPRGEAR